MTMSASHSVERELLIHSTSESIQEKLPCLAKSAHFPMLRWANRSLLQGLCLFPVNAPSSQAEAPDNSTKHTWAQAPYT